MATGSIGVDESLSKCRWSRGLALVRRLVALMCLFGTVQDGAAQGAAATPFVLGVEADREAYGTKWAMLVYTEAFSRLGIPVQFGFYPLARRTAMLDAGEIDGEPGRIYEYAAAHPNLIRIEEPFAAVNIALFAADPALRLQSLEQLRAGSLLVEYRRGILFCEKALTPLLPVERLSSITSEEQGVKKLMAGRIDLYCDLDVPVRRVLNSPEFSDTARVRKVFSLGSIQTYPYLHRKHAALAPLLAATLKAMKAEGLIEAYRVQVEQELKWTR